MSSDKMHDAIIPKNPIEIMEEKRKEAEEKSKGKNTYELKKKKKLEERERQKRKEKMRKISKRTAKYAFYVLLLTAAVGALIWFVSSRPKLPPTTTLGHSEGVPPSHILNEPIPDSIQRHMLEHADGRGKPGVIIQYNCKDFSCAPDLIEKLKTLVREYPDNVYLAPNKYSGKIILTKLGQREILDSFEEDKIRQFIEN